MNSNCDQHGVGYPFLGMLFTGFMLTPLGPKVLEYNVRFGDPETEALMLLLDKNVDLAALFLVRSSFVLALSIFLAELYTKACAEHRLDSIPVKFQEGIAVTVILASQGYPGSYSKGQKITFGEIPSSVFGPILFVEMPPYPNRLRYRDLPCRNEKFWRRHYNSWWKGFGSYCSWSNPRERPGGSV